MKDVFLCDAIRTPIGRYGGALSGVRTDDLAAIPIRALRDRCGGAIALGHPLGASGARLVTTTMHQMSATRHRYALCSPCVGVGQGIAMLIERI